MIDLKKIQRGRVSLPPRIVWYSFDGIGKTTALAGSKDPFILDMNRGSIKFDVARYSPTDYNDFLAWLQAVELGQISCSTLGLDSLTEIESLMIKLHFGDKGPNSGEWAFNRGEDYLFSKWRELLAQLERIWLQGKAIVMTAHARVAKFNDPTGPAYDRFELSLRSRSAEQVRQWVDFVCFCREEIVLDQSKTERTKGKTTGVRYQYTRRCPAYDAKARGTTLFPERLPLGWQPLIDAISADEARSVEMRAEVDSMLAALGDEVVTRKAIEWLRANPMGVVDIHNRVKVLLEGKRAAAEEIGTSTDSPQSSTV
jgi:AAA domain